MLSIYLIFNKKHNVYRSICKGQYQYNEIGDTKSEAIYNLLNKYGKQIGVEIVESAMEQRISTELNTESSKQEYKNSMFSVIKKVFNFKKDVK